MKGNYRFLQKCNFNTMELSRNFLLDLIGLYTPHFPAETKFHLFL